MRGANDVEGSRETGSHASGGRRSFLVSLGASALRVALVVVALVVGVVALGKAFPHDASRDVVGVSSPAASPTPSASPSPRATARPPRVHGVSVLVLNGTTRLGLAASTTTTLRSAGYTTRFPGDASTTPHTIVYYRKASLIDAQYLQRKYFPRAELKPAPAQYSSKADVTVVLGEDFQP